MLNAETPADERTHAVAMVRRQVESMKVLLNDLLDVSLLRLDKLVLQMRRIELVAVVQSAIEATRHAIDGAGHQLTLELPEAPVALHGDPVRLAQVLTNLLLNAVKYTPYGGRIGVQAGPEGRMVAITVSDSGIGMRPESVEAMFELFAREEPERDTNQSLPGLGVGLALARSIVALHGGTITGHSDGPGCGSRFVVCLPQSEETAPPLPEREPPQREAAGARVLIVDDNVDAVWGIATLLRAAGHEVATAHSGAHGLELVLAQRPDVVVLDVGLPDLSGHELARRIRAQPWGAATLLVAATGWGAQQDHDDSKAAGFDAHLVKPIDMGELRRLIARHAARRR